MYAVNDIVHYSPYGICKITDLSTKSIGGEQVQCFSLQPVSNDRCNILLPANNKDALARLQPPLSAAEAHALIAEMPELQPLRVENAARHKKQCEDILAGGDRRLLIQLIKTLNQRRQDQHNSGKKFNTTDERYMQEAEKMLYEEFSYALNIEPGQVLAFILERVKKDGLLADMPDCLEQTA